MNIAEQIAADMRKIPAEARKELRPALRAAGEAVASDARRRANWSERIPGTIKVQASFREDREGVTVTAGGKVAPHARPYEGVTGKPTFRHPVHADAQHKTRKAWTWVTETTRPFLLPAGQAGEGPTTTALLSALNQAALSLGFRE